MKELIPIFKQIFRMLLIGIALYFLSLPIYNYFSSDRESIRTFFFKDNKIKYSGVIIKRLNPIDDYTHKGTTRLSYEPTFVVDFKGYEITEVNVTTNDYYKHKEGDIVCYSFNKEMSTYDEIINFFTFLSGIIWCFGIIIGLIKFIFWAFDINVKF